MPLAPHHRRLEGFYGSTLRQQSMGGIAIVEKRHARGEMLPWHTHEQPYVTFVLRGGYREQLGASVCDCSAGMIIIHPPEETHSDLFPHSAAVLWNIVLLPGTRSIAGNATRALERRSVLRDAAFSSLAARLAPELDHVDDVSPLVVQSVLLELAALALRQTEPTRSQPPWLRRAQQLLRDRLREPPTLAELATELEVHPSTLVRAFRRYLGTSVGERLRQLRLQQASILLRSPLPLAEVALRCGFSDQSHLNRQFKAATGCTPRQFRNRLGMF